jgi:3-deoxy-manno-octulosonate cytidylyltransferase (CMP-KDO synthetase)
MPVLGVIPARLGSTRLPRKPLALLAGAPLITRVYDRAASFGLFDVLVVATDAAEIAEVATRGGATVAMTRSSHATGTERVAEVAARSEFRRFDIVVNVQGDEPFLPADAVRGAIERVRQGDDIGTAAAPLDPVLAQEPNRVKVVTDARGRALYFSRAPIPWVRDPGDSAVYWQHLGIYAYSRRALEQWVRSDEAPLERAERLEQLRALWYGLTIGVAFTERAAALGIDTPDDLARAELMYHDFHKGLR